MYKIILFSLMFLFLFLKPAMADAETIKILSIGNSFSQDIQTEIEEIANSAGVDVVVGNLYRSGESLEGHWKQAAGSRKSYQYQKKLIFNGEWKIEDRERVSLKDGLVDEEWDYITLQQTSGKSGIYRTYNPYLGKLMNYIGSYVKNPDATLTLHMTWAYSNHSTNKFFPHYGRNQSTMYRAIVAASQKAMTNHGISTVLPTGTAIQNARSHALLNDFDDELTADGHHLGVLGDYIGGLVLFETFIAEAHGKDLFKDVTYKPEEITEEQAYLAKLAAKEAVKKPFHVTEIEYLEQ
ncbi:DUF4886 domain-containing protein [Ureibacillus aquaedulcis]|uniref:DUF4886 domain-containing protein n=1 Tax=Ureibacillus aquaedulcis TaxID=3058421 RepID=A0ABT8GUK5_9BACL|nr:DUF4886 domain-containing protein [Ureibacillus sp. BA0131]MDN4495096.1 DUF4886 domain-containing protein [Ureibacillus sp. BA0131]